MAITTPDATTNTISGTSRRRENFAPPAGAEDGSLLGVIVCGDGRSKGMIRTHRHRMRRHRMCRHLAARRRKPRQRTDLSRPSTSKRRFHRLVTLAHALVPPPLVLALTTTGGLPYKPRDFGRGDPRSSGWTKGRG